MDLQSTLQGCERIFVHNVDGGESYLTERFFYEQAGTRNFVGACVAAANLPAIPHQLETVGWQYNDPAKNALPETRIYIVWNTEKFEVSSAQVRPDAVAVPYTYFKTETVPDAAGIYYEACSRYIPTNKSDIYNRPGGTQIAYPIGPGTPVGPDYACTTQSIEMVYGGFSPAGIYAVNCWYQGRGTLLREDGETVIGGWLSPSWWWVIDEQQNYRIVGTGQVKAYFGYNAECRANATADMIATFKAQFGL